MIFLGKSMGIFLNRGKLTWFLEETIKKYLSEMAPKPSFVVGRVGVLVNC